MQKFKKTILEVEAIQYNGNSNKQEVEKFIGRELKSGLESETAYIAGAGPPIFSLVIETGVGPIGVFRGDWIVKEILPTGDANIYVCKNNVFRNTYEII